MVELRHSYERKAPRRYLGDGTFDDKDSPQPLPALTPPLSDGDTCSRGIRQLRTPHCSVSDAAKPPHDSLSREPSPQSASALKKLAYDNASRSSATSPATTARNVSLTKHRCFNMRDSRPNKRKVGADEEDTVLPQKRPRPAKPPVKTPKRATARAALKRARSEELGYETAFEYAPLGKTTKPANTKEKPFGADTFTGRPAAFPSLDPTAKPVEESGPRHKMKFLLEDRESKDERKIKRSEELIDAVWACKAFPDDMEDCEKKWYKDVQRFMKVVGSDPKVNFDSLSPVLRGEIIDTISITENTETSKLEIRRNMHYPALVLLRLDKPAFDSILRENWTFAESEPDRNRLMKWKKKHPGQPFDADQPLITEVAKAIRYLKQAHLPGNLLGMWQYPLPKVEDFLAEESETDNEAPVFIHPTLSDDDDFQCPDDESELSYAQDTDDEVPASEVVVLRIHSKYLARLRAWGTVSLHSPLSCPGDGTIDPALLTLSPIPAPEIPESPFRESTTGGKVGTRPDPRTGPKQSKKTVSRSQKAVRASSQDEHPEVSTKPRPPIVEAVKASSRTEPREAPPKRRKPTVEALKAPTPHQPRAASKDAGCGSQTAFSPSNLVPVNSVQDINRIDPRMRMHPGNHPQYTALPNPQMHGVNGMSFPAMQNPQLYTINGVNYIAPPMPQMNTSNRLNYAAMPNQQMYMVNGLSYTAMPNHQMNTPNHLSYSAMPNPQMNRGNGLGYTTVRNPNQQMNTPHGFNFVATPNQHMHMASSLGYNTVPSQRTNTTNGLNYNVPPSNLQSSARNGLNYTAQSNLQMNMMNSLNYPVAPNLHMNAMNGLYYTVPSSSGKRVRDLEDDGEDLQTTEVKRVRMQGNINGGQRRGE